MSRFKAFNDDELNHLKTGLLSVMNVTVYEEGTAFSMYEDILKLEQERERARVAALPHCRCCNQILRGPKTIENYKLLYE